MRITASRRISTSDKPVDISGTVTEYEARNPHSYLHIAAVDENGKTQEYVCESHGFTQLTRNGITPEMLKPGTELRVDGSLSRHSPTMCFFNNVYFPDGRALSVNGPRGAQARAPASERFAAPHRHLRHVAARAESERGGGSAPRRHEPAAADDEFPDAGGRSGRRGLRPVQGRPDVPLRSGRDPPRLGRARHAARDRPRARSRGPAA